MTNTKLLTLEPMVQMMIRQRVDAARPSGILVYLLWAFLGIIGGHHYYMACKASGRLRTVFIVAGIIYTFTLGCFYIGWFVDLFLNPFYVKQINEENEEAMVNEYLIANGMMETSSVQPKVESYTVDGKYDDGIWSGK